MNLLDALLVALLIYVPNQLHFPADLGLKGMNVFNILLFLTLVAMVATGARARFPTPLRWRIGAFAAALFTSFILAQLRAPDDILADLTVLKSSVTYILLYFIFYHAARDRRHTRILVGVILFVAFVAGIEAVKEGLDYGLGAYSVSHRASGPFGQNYTNSNRAGVFYAMFLPLFLALLLLRGPGKLARLAGLIGTVTLSMAIFVTYSRQAYLIAAASLLGLATKRNVLVGALACTVLATWTLWAPQAAVERLEMTYVESDSGQEELEVSAESRLVIWQQALGMIRDHPLGVGLNRFRAEMGTYGPLSERDAHNSFVLIASEAGIQGLIAFLLVLAGLLGLGLRLIRTASDQEARCLAWGYTAAAACMILGNVYGSPVFFGEVMGNFWSLSGLIAAACNFERQAVTDAMPDRD